MSNSFHKGRNGQLSAFWIIMLILNTAFVVLLGYFSFLVNPYSLNGINGSKAIYDQLMKFQEFAGNNYIRDLNIILGVSAGWMGINWILMIVNIWTAKGRIGFFKRFFYTLLAIIIALAYLFGSCVWLITDFSSQITSGIDSHVINSSNIGKDIANAYNKGLAKYEQWFYGDGSSQHDFGNYRWMVWVLIFGNYIIMLLGVSVKKLGYKATINAEDKAKAKKAAVANK